jgi:hypothetical protein
MKRWAVLVVLLYLFILVSLTVPLILVAFYPGMGISLRGSAGDLFFWPYYIALGVMAAAQAVMLLVPVDLALHRPIARRSVLWPVLASGLMMGLLMAGAGFSIDEYLTRERADAYAAIPWVIGLAMWAGWSVVFYRTSRDTPPADVMARQCRYLLRGSLLELLVAVPTHIVARMRDYCCAGFYTFLGIAFGVSVMLFSFGPGVFFLFAARWKRLHPELTHLPSPS